MKTIKHGTISDMNLVRKYIHEQQGPNFGGVAVIGAGLPKTGTLSLKAAYGELLEGICYHGGSLWTGSRDEINFWERVVSGEKIGREEWVRMLQGKGVRAGVDLPFYNFYRELMEAFPDAKIILSVRDEDPDRWFESCRFTIQLLEEVRAGGGFSSFLARAFFWLCGMLRSQDLTLRIHDLPLEPCGKNRPYAAFQCATSLGLTQAIREGRKSAIRFYHDWNEGVKQTVPKDRLLVYSVKEGWGPICDFLQLPVPDKPFPKVNNRQSLGNLNLKLWIMIYSTAFGFAAVFAALLGLKFCNTM